MLVKFQPFQHSLWELSAHPWSILAAVATDFAKGIETNPYAPRTVVVVVVFFTLTDRASTIPSNTRGCQSGTWSAGQKKIRGTSTKLQ